MAVGGHAGFGGVHRWCARAGIADGEGEGEGEGEGKCVDRAAPMELVLWDREGSHRVHLPEDERLEFGARGGYVLEIFANWGQGRSASYVYKLEAR